MAELTGFTVAEKLGPDLGPQSIHVPPSKEAAIAAASTLVGAFFDVVEAGLTPNLTVEFLKRPDTGQTYCRITPWNTDGVTKTVANPGQWVAIDGTRLVAMSNSDYASQFTQDVPLEWAAVSTAPEAAVGADGKVTLSLPQPTSANRPFSYAVNQGGTPVSSLAPIVVDGRVTLPLDLTLAEGDAAELTVTVTATKYGTTATSAPVSASRPAPEPASEQ